MTIKHFVNRKTGVSTDYKPRAQNLEESIYIETDTGSFWTSTNGINIKQLQGAEKAETITNKEIDTETNIIDTQSIIDYPFSNTYKVKGGIIPAADIPNSFYGVLEGGTQNNPDKISSQSNGLSLQYTGNNANDIMGYNPNVPICTRSQGYTFEGEIYSSVVPASRVMFGFCSQPNFDIDYILNPDQSGVAVGYTKFETNFIVYCNNADGLPVSKTVLPIARDTNLHYIKIDLNLNNILVKFDTLLVTLTKKLPTLNTPLFPIGYGVN